MTQRRVPRLATALLARLSENDALAGDLREAYLAGKSSSWYWRQVLVGIAVGVWRDSREQTVLAVGTVLGAAMLVSSADQIAAPARGWLMYQVLQPAAWSHPLIARHGFIVLWITDVAPFAVSALLSGWTIRKLSEERHGLVVLFSLVVFLGLLWRWSITAAKVMFVVPRHLPMPYLLLFLAGQILIPPFLALLGGLLSTPSRPVPFRGNRHDS